MKSGDLIQLGALAVVGYLAWQKFGTAIPKPSTGNVTPPVPLQPSQQAAIPIDFGITDTSSWDDTSTLWDLF